MYFLRTRVQDIYVKVHSKVNNLYTYLSTNLESGPMDISPDKISGSAVGAN